MIHFQVFTEAELKGLSGFLILKDDDIFKVDDFVCITVRNDVKASDETTEDKRLTRSQVFFTITDVQTSANAKGVRRGYALVKIKRTKNPIPKKVDDLVEETEADADEN